MSFSLYIHVPFCLRRCSYCDFVSGNYIAGKAASYIDALQHEISIIDTPSPVSTLYIGGGTPTVLPSVMLSNLITCVFSRYRFNDDYEATIEANPGTLDSDKLFSIYRAGMNRISIGIQSFHGDELACLGRVHSAEDAELSVLLARKAGFKNIGIDLIYGIPGQTFDSWKESLEKAVRLKPGHISTYELTIEKGTELFRRMRSGLCFPSESVSGINTMVSENEVIDMYEYAIDFLAEQGFIHYELSNFALPGFECRHNLNYWDRGDYAGIGLGAHSFVNGKRFKNTNILDEYIDKALQNKQVSDKYEKIPDDKALSEALFLGLRKTSGINIEPLARAFNVNILKSYNSELNNLLEAGLIEITASQCSYETNLRLTRKGLSLSNEVFVKFI